MGEYSVEIKPVEEQLQTREAPLTDAIKEEKRLLGKVAGNPTVRNMALVLSMLSSSLLFQQEAEAAPTQVLQAPSAERQVVQTKTEEQVSSKKDFYTIEFQEQQRPQSEITEKIKLIYLWVVNDGKAKSLVLSQKELEKNPTLTLKGYIANILVFTEEGMEVELNGEKANKIKKTLKEDDHISVRGSAVYPTELATDEYNEEFFKKLFSGELNENKDDTGDIEYELKGGYFFGRDPGAFYLGLPVNRRSDNTLSFKIGEKVYGIPIKQEVFREFRKIDTNLFTSQEDLHFLYLGNNLEGIYLGERINDKLQAIAEAVKNVEDSFFIDLIDTVWLIDYEAKNAFTTPKYKFIAFLSEEIKKSSPESIRNTTEHELLHSVTEQRGYTEDRKLRGIFADLKGYTDERKQRIIEKGFTPFDDFNEKYQNKTFFAFIAETNFFKYDESGHPHGDVWEFYTSFLHTLIDLDRLEANLERSIKIKEYGVKKQITLTHEDKMSILDNYTTVLGALIEKEYARLGLLDFISFQKNLDKVRQVKKNLLDKHGK